MSQRPRLYLIDGYSNIFRAYYAIRNLSSSKGEPTGAVYGFLQMLRKILKDEEPRYLGVAFDVSAKTVRQERYAEYKANRKPMPDDLKSQIPWIRKVIEAFKIPLLEKPGYEADDVLGTLARKAVAAGYEVVLISPDKDLMQLVTDDVSVYHTGREKLYNPARVTEHYGVAPEQIVDMLALMGDSSDNVPGVKGIGAKGASKLVAEYGSLEVLLERAAEVKRKSYREGLQQHREEALLSKGVFHPCPDQRLCVTTRGRSPVR